MVKIRYCGNYSFIFAWDLGVIVLGILNWAVGGLMAKFLVLKVSWKMCGLFPCIPILGFFFLIKKRGMCNNFKNALLPHFYVFLWLRRVYVKKGVLGSCKTYYFSLYLHLNFVLSLYWVSLLLNFKSH